MVRPDAFHFSNGQHADDARQLRAVLKLAPREVTGRHIASGQNDYVPWVRNVLGDETLARKLEKCRSVDQALEVLDEHLDGPKPKQQRQPPKAIPEHTPERPATPVERPGPLRPALAPVVEHETLRAHASKDFLLGFGLGIVLALIIYAVLQALL